MGSCKPIETSLAKGEYLRVCPLTPKENQKMTIIPYASTVGSLMYIMIFIRPDIVYVVGLVRRYQSDLSPVNCQAVKRIFIYLKGIANYSLSFKGGDLELIGYIDTDWASNLEHHKSTYVYIFLLNRGTIS